MKFLTEIYGKSEGYFSIATRGASDEIDSERWLAYPKDLPFAQKYVELRADEDVYCSTNLFSEKVRTNEDPLAVANVVAADADTCHPDNFRLEPSIVVQTSPGHWHVWWVLSEPVPAAEASAAARRIANAHKDQGCDNGWQVSKLLRVPGTTNRKRLEPAPVTAEYAPIVYTLDQINAAYADVPVTPKTVLDAAQPDLLGEDERIELEQALDSAGLADLYLKHPGPGQSWSERLFRLELDLFRIGMTAQEVFTLAENAACNKFAPEMAGQFTQTGIKIPKRNNPLAVLWKDVQRAQVEYQDELAAQRDRAPEEAASSDMTTFLTLDERRLLEDNPTFIEKYVAWAKGKSPMSATTYHRSLAYMLLSAQFSDRVYLKTSWSTLYPNLWLLLLGDTTSTKKSTSMDFFLDFIHLIGGLEGSDPDIGSDTTVEALLQLLGTRDGQVSLLHTDEVDRFFSDNLVKNYRAGTMTALTDLYGGRVQVVLRATKGSGNRVRAKTRFMFLGVGIREDVAKTLTTQNLKSGFLGRMLWSVADPAPYHKGDADMLLDEADEYGKYDTEMNHMASDLMRRKAYFSPDDPTKMTIEKDALDRLNDFSHTMITAVIRMNPESSMRAAAERLRDSVFKAAILLAAYHNETTVTLYTALAAIQQAEFWFNDMVRMTAEVSSSDFGRLRDEVLRFITAGKDHRVTEASIYKKFTFRPAEFAEVIKALTSSGDIRYVPNDRKSLEVLM